MDSWLDGAYRDNTTRLQGPNETVASISVIRITVLVIPRFNNNNNIGSIITDTDTEMTTQPATEDAIR